MRRILSLLFLMIFALSAYLCPVYAEEASSVIYVSPSGDDAASGSKEDPIRTLEEAKNRVKRLEKSEDSPVYVRFMEGTYRFSETVLFDDDDAGYAIYEADEGAEVRFTNSVELDKSKFQDITDENILSRIHPQAEGKVKMLDLAEQGITHEQLGTVLFKSWFSALNNQFVGLYYNGKEEMISQWPNGENEFSNYKRVVSYDSGGKKGIIEYSEADPDRWVEAKHAYTMGYWIHSYAIDKMNIEYVDPATRTISLINMEGYGLGETSGNRWKALHLLEEIDLPGEWYIDTDNLILYWYPEEYDGGEGTLELGLYKTPIIEVSTKSNNTPDMHLTFRGITFTQSRVTPLVIKDVNYVTVEDCDFGYLRQFGVYVNQCGYIRIDGNRFYHIEGHAIREADYRYSFTGDEPPIELTNNYIYECAKGLGTMPHAICVDEQNILIGNNTMHHLNGAAVSIGQDYAFDVNVQRNEMYNATQMRSDIGVIYAGKSRISQGHDISYNFIYDMESRDTTLLKEKENGRTVYVIGIYMDDTMSGAHIHHNIIANTMGSGIQIGGGQNHTIDSNIIIDCDNGAFLTDNRGETWSTNWDSLFKSGVIKTLSKPYAAKRNPQVADSMGEDAHAPWHNAFVNNVTDKPVKINERVEELGVVDNNIVGLKNDFVDPEKFDYRIKDSSPLLQVLPDLPSESSFDLQNVGVPAEVANKLIDGASRFYLTVPANGATGINANKQTLVWQSAVMSDEYDVVIATDKEFKDIVEQVTVPYPYYTPSKLESNQTYYWTVTARNTGKREALSREWKPEVEVYSFTTTEKDVLDILHLESMIARAENEINSLDTTRYDADLINELRLVIEECRARAAESDCTNDEIYSMADKVMNLLEEVRRSEYLEYQTLTGDLLTADGWETGPDTTAKGQDMGNGEIKFSRENGVVERFYIPTMFEDDIVMSFDMKVDWPESAFPASESAMAVIQTLRQKNDVSFWGDKGYMAVLKPHNVELQKYPGGILQVGPNNVVKDEQWYNVKVATYQRGESKRFIVKIDDQVLFDYTDLDYTKLPEKGYLMLDIPPEGSISVRPAAIDDEEGSAESKTTLKKLDMREFSVDTSSADYIETGEWKTAEGSSTRTSNDAKATAVFKASPGPGVHNYYFYVDKCENPDEAAQLEIFYNFVKGQEGDELTEVRTIDFANLSEGWHYITTEDILSGEITFTLKSSSGKGIAANAIKVVDAENSFRDTSAIFKAYPVAAVLKADNRHVYIGNEEYTTAQLPSFIGDKVMIPVRVAAEVYGASVEWNDAEGKAVLKNADNIFNLTDDGKDIRVTNGITYLSADKIREIFGVSVAVNDGVVVLGAQSLDDSLWTIAYSMFK